MTLGELREIVRRSVCTDWRMISCWGPGSGPSYRVDDGRAELHDGRFVQRAHFAVATYTPYIDISIAWGMPSDLDDQDVPFDWDESFAGLPTTMHLADVFYRGALVDRAYQAAVEGGRAYLPVGRRRLSAGSPSAMGPDTHYDVIASAWEVDFARLIHRFEHHTDFDAYLARAGHLIEADELDGTLADDAS